MEDSDYVPGQVVVQLQYSHNLGDVNQRNLLSLLDDLSAYRCHALQWTLSAPIQACVSNGSDSNQLNSTPTTAATATNQFCMTKPCASCSAGSWPDVGVTETTDTILVDYWFSAAEVLHRTDVDSFVKQTISTWVKRTLKFPGSIWIVSRFTEQLCSQADVVRGKVKQTTTINKVMGRGYGTAEKCQQ